MKFTIRESMPGVNRYPWFLVAAENEGEAKELVARSPCFGAGRIHKLKKGWPTKMIPCSVAGCFAATPDDGRGFCVSHAQSPNGNSTIAVYFDCRHGWRWMKMKSKSAATYAIESTRIGRPPYSGLCDACQAARETVLADTAIDPH